MLLENLAQVQLPPPPQFGQQGRDPNFARLSTLLHDCDYKLPLPAEGALLVYRLFTDLVQLSQSAIAWRDQNEANNAQIDQLQQQLYPLRRENQRLVRANNAIHLQAMKVLRLTLLVLSTNVFQLIHEFSFCYSHSCTCHHRSHRTWNAWMSVNASGELL
jgi:hypothetical protein